MKVKIPDSKIWQDSQIPSKIRKAIDTDPSLLGQAKLIRRILPVLLV